MSKFTNINLFKCVRILFIYQQNILPCQNSVEMLISLKQSHLQKHGYFCSSGILPVPSHEEESICKVLNKPLGSALER